MGELPPSTDGLREALLRQRDFVAEVSPSYARLFDGVLALQDTLWPALQTAWAERDFVAWYERPLLLAASLRFDALLEGRNHALWAALASDPPDPAQLSDLGRLRAAFDPERTRVWESLRSRHVQTNETSRAIAWLWPAAQLPQDARLALFDLGASAGLNLLAEALPFVWRDGQGAAVPAMSPPPIVQRVALDLRPLDASSSDTAAWLRACVWPEQHERLLRLDAALRLAATTPVDWIEAAGQEMPSRLSVTPEATHAIAYQTIMRDYLDDDSRDAMAAGMRAWLGGQAPGRALWVELEVDHTADDDPPRAVTLEAHLRSAGGDIVTLTLARTHPHPRTLYAGADAERLGPLLA